MRKLVRSAEVAIESLVLQRKNHRHERYAVNYRLIHITLLDP